MGGKARWAPVGSRGRPRGGIKRLPIVVAVLAVALLAGDAAGQHRAAVASQTRPRPLTTRPMGVPASVHPSGRPLPGSMLDRRHPIVPPGGFLPVYAYPQAPPYAVNPFAYPPVLYWPITYPPHTHSPYGYAASMTVVEPLVTRSRVEVTTVAAPAPTGCAVVEIRVSGQRWRNVVPLPSLGASTPAGLRDVIAGRLAAGRQVPLQALNGTRLVLPAGYDPAELSVEPCDEAAPAGTRDGS